MFPWFNTAGFKANIADLRKCYPETQLHTLQQWLYDEGWHKRAPVTSAHRRADATP